MQGLPGGGVQLREQCVVIFDRCHMKWRGKKDQKPNPVLEMLDALRAWREIGQMFSYLGRHCVVIGHWSHSYEQTYPCLRYEYADDEGRICRDEKPGWLAIELIERGVMRAIPEDAKP